MSMEEIKKGLLKLVNDETDKIKTEMKKDSKIKIEIGEPEERNNDILVYIKKNSADLKIVKDNPDKKYYDKLKDSYKSILDTHKEYSNFYMLAAPYKTDRNKIYFAFIYKGIPAPENPETTKSKTEEGEEEEEEEEEEVEDSIRPFDSVSQAPPRGTTIQTQVNFATDAKGMTDSDIDRLDLKSVIGSVMGKKANITESEFKELLKQNRDALPILKEYITRRASKSQSAKELKTRLDEFALLNRMEKSQDSEYEGKNYVVRPIKKPKNPVKGRIRRR